MCGPGGCLRADMLTPDGQASRATCAPQTNPNTSRPTHTQGHMHARTHRSTHLRVRGKLGCLLLGRNLGQQQGLLLRLDLLLLGGQPRPRLQRRGSKEGHSSVRRSLPRRQRQFHACCKPAHNPADIPLPPRSPPSPHADSTHTYTTHPPICTHTHLPKHLRQHGLGERRVDPGDLRLRRRLLHKHGARGGHHHHGLHQPRRRPRCARQARAGHHAGDAGPLHACRVGGWRRASGV